LAANKLLTTIFTSLLAFAFLYPFIGTNLICDCATACADGTPDKRAFSSAQQSSSNGAPCRGAADDLCSGVMAMVMGGLRALGSFVALRLGLRPLRKA
jgi:hypothetical protein